MRIEIKKNNLVELFKKIVKKLLKWVLIVFIGFILVKKLPTKFVKEIISGLSKNLVKKLKTRTRFEKTDVITNKIKTIVAEIPLKKKPIGFDNELKKSFEKIRHSCLMEKKNLFKSQSVLHFTFDYLFFYLIK